MSCVYIVNTCMCVWVRSEGCGMSGCSLDYKAEYAAVVETSQAAGRRSPLSGQPAAVVGHLPLLRFLLYVFCLCFLSMYQGINQYTGGELESLCALLKGASRKQA